MNFDKPISDKSHNFAVAILIGFNEQDIVRCTIRHALGQGLHVFYVDDHSTDATRETIVAAFGNDDRVGYTMLNDKYRAAESGQTWDLRKQLCVKRDLAKTTFETYDWILHMDCDELYTCSWAMTVAGGLHAVPPEIGVVTCIVYDYFPSTNDAYEWDETTEKDDISDCLRVYRQRNHFNSYPRFLRNNHAAIDFGIGHDAKTEPNTFFKWCMTMHHFPYRNCTLAAKKVQEDRLPRIAAGDKAKGYGYHYSLLDKLMLPVDPSVPPSDCSRHCTGYRTRTETLGAPSHEQGDKFFTVFWGGRVFPYFRCVTNTFIDAFCTISETEDKVDVVVQIPATTNFNRLFGDPWPNLPKTLTIVDAKRANRIWVIGENLKNDVYVKIKL